MDPIAVILVAAGIVFLFAALIGGKLKLWKFIDVDVNSPRSKIVQIISGCLGIVLLVVGIGVHKGMLEYPLNTPPGITPELSKEFTNVRYFDDFTSKKLSSKWKIVEPDPKRWTLQSNRSALQIITQKGSIWESDKNLKNQFVLDSKLPEADYEVIVKASFHIQSQHNSLSIALFQDDDNFLEVGFSGRVGPINNTYIMRVPHFTKEINGKRNVMLGEEKRWQEAESPETIFLRIERIGNQYSGYYAFVDTRPPEDIGDIRWTKIGTQAWINFSGRMSFWADNSNSNIVFGGPPLEVNAEFDFVLIRSK